MYHLGAKTVVFGIDKGEFYEIDLFDGNILPLTKSDFEGFSFFKRVIKDRHWNALKSRAASRLNTSSELIEILLMIPMPVETRWIGHQVNVFTQMSIPIPNIETVEARFQGSKLKIVRVHLKDGSTRTINDETGA